MTISSSITHSPLSNRASEIVCKHSENAFITTSTSAIISTSDLLSFSSALCDHVSEDHFMTQDLKTLYNMHLIENAKTLRCNWFTQAKRTQESYHLRKHELKIKNKFKKKMKQLTKQKKKVRLVKKRAKKYTCRRCKIKFDSNIKLHEHIRIRHAKKSKPASLQFVVSSSSESKSSSSSESVIFSSFSSKSLSLAISTPEIVRERSESVSSKSVTESSVTSSEFSSVFSSIETSKKSISWTEIVSRSIVALKLSRFPIATFKSMCKSLKNANVACSFISSRTFTSSKFYLIVNDLFRMFVEKPNSFDLQSNQNKSLFSRSFGKCSFKSKCDLIQSRITLYFHAMILFASKSIKFETFASIHVSMKHSIRTSLSRIFRFFSSSMRFFFSAFSRSSFVCKHCQRRFVIYRFIDWVMSSVSRVENNEISMEMRYWNFVSLRSTLRKYWFSWDHYFEKVSMLFVCSFALSINRWLIWEKHKSCCCCCCCCCFNEFDVSLLPSYFGLEEL